VSEFIHPYAYRDFPVGPLPEWAPTPPAEGASEEEVLAWVMAYLRAMDAEIERAQAAREEAYRAQRLDSCHYRKVGSRRAARKAARF
jgi:hypothetical protein